MIKTLITVQIMTLVVVGLLVPFVYADGAISHTFEVQEQKW